MERTARWGLTILNDLRETLAQAGHRFGLSDRELIDRLFAYGVEHHRHDAVVVTPSQSLAPVVANLQRSGGQISAGATPFYRWSLVDNKGHESDASVILGVAVPTSAEDPDVPSIASAAGSLTGGVYSYVVSAYTDVTTQETNPSLAAVITLPSGGGVTLGLPMKPSSADGFNVYRKGPSDLTFKYIGSTTDVAFSDTGATATEARTAPTANTTNSMNAVELTLPEALPANHVWRLYRTYDQSNWADSLIYVGSDGSFVDHGGSPQKGTPHDVNRLMSGPSKIDLTGVAEVEGVLPSGMLVFPTVVTFSFPGVVSVGAHSHRYVSEWLHGTPIAMRATLGYGSAPASTPVIVGALTAASGAPNTTTPLTEHATVPVGQRYGSPVMFSDHEVDLTPGASLGVQVIQGGGGATPTDYALVVSILLMVNGGVAGDDETTHVWSS